MGMLGDNGGFMEVPIGHGLKARVTFVSCGGVTAFNIPECPIANGTVDGKGRGEFSVTFEIRSSSESYPETRRTPNRKQKSTVWSGLTPNSKSIDVEHTEEVFIVASIAGSYPIVIRGGVTRKVHIPMPRQNMTQPGQRCFFGDPLDPNRRGVLREYGQIRDHSYKRAEEKWSGFETALLRRTDIRP